ncbi:dol-P-Man:Man(5)GlcNAc(2)-PP-Dol alpha-1,3-mannosyltransferase-like [Clavelina lepadiformis]|uniref:dol-P-Man:Man(5)GlcNAc(2)-PP-Dol alpha-1,3-mannosyltransferase-like n=1 Tax=Clavelina lepadiformis TaxID=159417 RepID=UPI004041068E
MLDVYRYRWLAQVFVKISGTLAGNEVTFEDTSIYLQFQNYELVPRTSYHCAGNLKLVMASSQSRRKSFPSISFKMKKDVLKLFFDPSYTWLLGLLLCNVEIFINLFVINKVKYTEVDWLAYMQEVGGFLNGTCDYMQLKGDTGPLVYPAGFVYIYSLLYYATNNGQNIRLAQYIFFIFYLINHLLVVRIYHKTKLCPPYVLLFLTCTSYRVHSLFVLRLFNDPIAMLILYIAINLFIDRQWYLGSLVYSIAVSVKMNILLFAPGLLLLYLVGNGIKKTIINLSICASLQVVFAIPFLRINPLGYVIRSFDLGRQFFHQWTVNWRFLSEDLFADRRFHFVLLFSHITILFLFAAFKWKRSFSDLCDVINVKKMWGKGQADISSNQIVLILFTSNFIGICFSRSLHYQFYIWYYHTLPYLLWSTPYQAPVRLLLFGVIELCWNTFPSTNLSSSSLHLCHTLLLLGLWKRKEVVRAQKIE